MRPSYIDSALKEIGVLSKLRHPNIVAYEGSDRTTPGYLHIYMEYCDGGDLEKVMRKPKSRDDYFCQPVSLWEIFFQMASAIAFCHGGVDLYNPTKTTQRGCVLHRDIKPSNVFLKLDEDGFPHVKLGDFGTAAVITSTLKDPSTYTGTKLYWAPEINKEVQENIENGEYRITKWSKASDVWSMAKTINVYYQSFPARVLQPEAMMIALVNECLEPDSQRRPSAVNVAGRCKDMGRGYIDRINDTLVPKEINDLKLDDSNEATLVPSLTEETQEKLNLFLEKHDTIPSKSTDDDLWKLLSYLMARCHGKPSWMDSKFDKSLAEVKEMLSLWPVPRSQPRKMGELLVTACRYCADTEIELIELILRYNPSLEELEEHKYTPLHWSIQKKGGGVGALLVKHGADPLAEIKAWGSSPTTPFDHALSSVAVFPDAMKIIREMFKSPKLIPPEKGRKAALTKYLMLAAKHERPQVVHLLVIEFGATGNVSQHGRGMMSLLQYAALHKDLELAQYLLDQNYDVHGLPISETPLQLAAAKRDNVMAQLLLNHGADPNKLGSPRSDSGRARSPLQAAIETKNHSMAKALIEAGANPNEGSREYRSVLTMAARNGDEESIHILLDAGIQPTTTDWYTIDTPLSWAARNRHMNAFKVLLDATTDIEASAPSTLWSLCQYEHCAEAVRMLLKRGVSPNEYRHEKMSMLFVATQRKNTEIMRLLVEYGADPDAPGDFRGQTPRMIAEQTFDTTLIEALNGDE
jgi:serine/threonine protein kinase/ankyrin repeat protein